MGVRLASLTCSNTEILDTLGLLPQLVAVDDHSDAPGVDHAARIGPDLSINVPRLAALRPDLTLASLSVPGMERVVAQLEAAGLPHLILDPVTLGDVYADILTVGRTLGRTPKAQAIVAEMQAELHQLRASFARPPRVAVEWWPRPVIVAGARSWVTDLLAALGAENAFGHLDARSSPITLDDLRAAAPDLIACSWCGVRKLRPEVIEARGLGVPVACIPESGLGRPGPRLLEGARSLAAALGAWADHPAADLQATSPACGLTADR